MKLTLSQIQKLKHEIWKIESLEDVKRTLELLLDYIDVKIE